MTLRVRVLLILLFVLCVPFLLPVTAYLLFRISESTSEVNDINQAPAFVLQEIPKIMSERDGYANHADPRILVVIIEDEGPIYVNREMREFLENKTGTFTHNTPVSKNRWELISGLFRQSEGAILGTSLFTYKGEGGIALYRFHPRDPLIYIFKHPAVIFSILFLILLGVISFFSVRILISLRKSLYTLEEGAKQISAGNMETPVDIPKDREIKPVFTAFEQMREQLKENKDQKTRFLMAISHDLKTPLTTVKGFLEALNEGLIDTPEKRERYYRILLEKAEILEGRISELIDFARMDTVNWQNLFDNFRIKPFLTECANRHTIEAEAYEVDFSFDIELPDGLSVHGDKRLLTRTIENLIDNAIRYSGEKKTVHFSAFQVEERLVMTIEDSGEGISRNERHYVFNPFYRGDKSRNTKGFGLGLTSVKSVVEAHNGLITIDDSRLGGAKFTVELPSFF